VTDIWTLLVGELGERAAGPLSLRLFIQPTVAVALAVRDGLHDARDGRAPYLWSIASDPAHRRDLIREGWKSIAKVFILVVVLDLLYQYLTGGPILVRQSLFLAVILAVIPYALIRGPVTRIARRGKGSA
jgi:hypothetical protein